MESRFMKANVIDRIHSGEAWCAALDSVSINADSWWCIVTMMIETTAGHSRYVSLFNEAAEERKLTRIYPLSYQKAMITVKMLSRQDPEKCSVVQGICHYANTIINENNGDLSAWLTARIIKYLIYRAKTGRVGGLKLQTDLDNEIEKEHRTIKDIDVSTSSQSTMGYRRTGSRETERIFHDKANTRLRKRYEERRDDAYDEPFDRPNFYVVLSGFHDPDLPAELLNAGVPLVCILEIEAPVEQYVAHRELMGDYSTPRKKSRFSEDYRVSEKRLMEFWTITRERLARASTYPAYLDIAVLNFSPSILPVTFNASEKESLKRDIYDKAALALCRLYNLCRQHANYLRSMKLEKRIHDLRDETGENNKIYENALNDIPNEYIDVPLILGALLLQVEANLAAPLAQRSVDRNTGFNDADTKGENKSATVERLAVSTVREKLESLDYKYELGDVYAGGGAQWPSQPSDLKLVLHGDTLSDIAYRFFDREPIGLVDSVLHVLRNPRITSIWRDRKKPTELKTNIYSCHLDNIARAFNQTVNREQVMDYLHLLIFDKWIFSGNEYETGVIRATHPPEDEPSELRRARSTAKRVRSEPNLKSDSIIAPNLHRCSSDTAIDYGKPTIALIECPLFLSLIDVRKALLSGYLYKNVCGKGDYGRPTIDEYEDVELLSDRVFRQVAHECFQSFDRFAVRYFEPTDSALLYFSNNEVGSMSEETHLSSIRTPVRLGEFCKYIAREEENWMKREQETHQSRGMDPTERLMKKSVEMEETAIIFDDGRFILPDSLKGRRLRRSPDRDTPRKISETKRFAEEAMEEDFKDTKIMRQKRNEVPMMKNRSKRAHGGVTNGETSMTEKKTDSKIDDTDTFFLPRKNILSSRCAEEGEPHDFVGYDLGSLRVQVFHRSKRVHLHGDISVEVELEDWLHGHSDLRVAVVSQDCALRLSDGINRCRSADTFHLTTRKGIVIGFCQNRDLDQNSSNHHWRNLAFDFRASWPSGLLIEPTVGDGTKNPFCIRQSYVSKRPVRAGATREVCRNFLRDGTVLKYLDDNTVVILRPNGVIVTCMDFDKPQSRDESTRRIIVKTKPTIRKGNSKQTMLSERKGKIVDSTYLDGSIVVNQTPEQRALLGEEEYTTANRDDSLITLALATGKVLRYTVVNYNGRRYEVLNDTVVSEYDRLLVKTVSDYEIDQIFTRRADDTDMLFRSNGELVVTFGDGTRIITGYTIEEEPLICEWSDDELQRYFAEEEFVETDSRYGNEVSPPSKSRLPRDNSRSSYLNRREKLTRISIADGFVSILLTCRMEHRDYATVSYDQSAVNCTLSMPDDLRVSISGRGHYEVSIGDEVNLKIRNDDVEFSKMCTTCGGSSMATYIFRGSTETDLRTILTTVDILGNVLEIKNDGTARYYHEDHNYARRGYECNGDVLERNEERINEKENASLKASFHCKHERYCEKLKFPAKSQYRIFAMNRDLTAREYLHRSVRREQETRIATVFDDGTSMIQRPISRRPELRRLITFVPVEPELGSKEMFYRQRVASDERTNRDGIELSRSTYSFPYNWLFPFGKRDQGAPKRTRNEHPLPELLRTRVFFGIKEADRSILNDTQRAMGRYWISILRDGDKCRSLCATTNGRLRQVESDYESLQDKLLRDLTFGVKKSIDVQTYVRSLRGKLIKMSTKAPRQSSRLEKLLRQRASMKEEYEWYKQCMRKRITAPYFRSVADSCYFLIKDFIEQAMRMSEESDLRVADKKKRSYQR